MTTTPRTTVQLCKSIVATMSYLPKSEQDSIVRCYNRTWTIAALHDAGLISPKPSALPYLASLWEVVDRAREEQLGLQQTRQEEFADDVVSDRNCGD